MNEIVLSPLAETDLSDIWIFVADHSSTAADLLIDRIYDRCQLLARRPKAGRRRPELAVDLRSFAVGSYVIFYRETSKGIEVARVLHGRRDIRTILKS